MTYINVLKYSDWMRLKEVSRLNHLLSLVRCVHCTLALKLSDRQVKRLWFQRIVAHSLGQVRQGENWCSLAGREFRANFIGGRATEGVKAIRASNSIECRSFMTNYIRRHISVHCSSRYIVHYKLSAPVSTGVFVQSLQLDALESERQRRQTKNNSQFIP